MHRAALLVSIAIACGASGKAQIANTDTAAALTFSRTYSLPLARTQVHDAAVIAWKRSFGREPAAKLERNDRESGVLEGGARVNYRSVPLTAREETMGVISYRVMVRSDNGECRVMITGLRHTGNRSAMNGGIDFGALTQGTKPGQDVPGLGRRNRDQIYADMKTQTTDRLEGLLQAFGSELRRSMEP